jgi:hypothetical protein
MFSLCLPNLQRIVLLVSNVCTDFKRMQVLLDRQKFVFYNPTATTAAAAREKYKTNVEKWFARPAECNMVAFRSYFEEYMVAPLS